MNGLTLGSLFDGIGGFPFAAQRCGIETLWASEIEPNCIAITKRHFPGIAHLGSITEIDGGKIPPVDIISFGSPCQDLSVAGKQKGIDGARSGLFKEAIRIIYEMRCATNGIYPAFVIWENVNGAFTSNGGGDFRRVLEEITKSSISMPVSGKWAKAGMVRTGGVEIAWRQLDAQYWRVPQRRKRIFLVGDFGGQRAAEILFKCESLLGYSQPGGTEEKRIAADTESGIGVSSGNCVIGSYPINDAVIHGAANGLGIGNDGDPAPTLTGRDRHGIIFCEVDPHGGYEQEETVVDFGRSGDRIRVNAQKSATIIATDGGGGAATGLYLLPAERAKLFEEYRHSEYRETDTAGTLRASGGSCGPGSESLVTLPVERATAGFSWFVSAGAGSTGYEKEKCPCIRATKPPAVIDTLSCHISGTKENGGILGAGEQIMLLIRYILRKLTPLECERLQGFPDYWTKYTATGAEIKDTPRYVALGNSLAVPCAERVFRGIIAVLSR